MRTIDQMIHSEVLVCLSSLVSTLANGDGVVQHARSRLAQNQSDLADIYEQAAALCYGVDDWEEAAIQAGWALRADGMFINPTHVIEGDDGETDLDPHGYHDWQALCADQDVDPYQREVFEHWAVTDWFANKLIAGGEKVDKDFGGMCVWARTLTGQHICADGVVERIYAEMMAA